MLSSDFHNKLRQVELSNRPQIEAGQLTNKICLTYYWLVLGLIVNFRREKYLRTSHVLFVCFHAYKSDFRKQNYPITSNLSFEWSLWSLLILFPGNTTFSTQVVLKFSNRAWLHELSKLQYEFYTYCTSKYHRETELARQVLPCVWCLLLFNLRPSDSQ